MYKYKRLCRSLWIVLFPLFTAHAVAQGSPVQLRPIFVLNVSGIDGLIPGGLILGVGGVLFGTTGAIGRTFGEVYQLTPPASPGQPWIHTTLHNFDHASYDGSTPVGALALGTDGSLYGTTAAGGVQNGGIVYRLIPPVGGAGSWTEMIIHAFDAGSGDGFSPNAGVAIGSDGTLYGTTTDGGTAAQGCVYQITPPLTSAGAWTETILHSFTGPDGAIPFAPVVIGPKGALYGTTYDGGDASFGTVFELDPPLTKQASWKIQVLHSFPGGDDGMQPSGPVVLGKTGVYGTVPAGGTLGGGIAFKLEQDDSGSWTENILYAFSSPSSGPSRPEGPIVIGEGGSVFGTASLGGDFTACSSGCGSVYRLDPPQSGSSWIETAIYTFTGASDGALPVSGIIFGPDQTAFGANGGGPSTFGLVFQLIP